MVEDNGKRKGGEVGGEGGGGGFMKQLGQFYSFCSNCHRFF